MKFLITGGCGFLGTNLALNLIKKRHDVILLDDLSRQGSEKNLAYLKSQNGNVVFYKIDIVNFDDLIEILGKHKPEVILHFAAQVAMTTSLENPIRDFKVNSLGTLNILEAIRFLKLDTIVAFSSTNKVYGSLNDYEYIENDNRYSINQEKQDFDERTSLDFSSPYGCSKGSADQYMRDYYRIFGIKTIIFRHSTIYGEHQYASVNQGWVGWFISEALNYEKNRISEIEISGNGKQVRDLLHIDDLTECYLKAIDKIEITQGRIYNIGGGFNNSLSILELFEILKEKLNIMPNFKFKNVRISDQKVFISDNSKANMDFNWEPKVSITEGIERMITWQKTINK